MKKKVFLFLRIIINLALLAFAITFTYIVISVYMGKIPDIAGYRMLRVISSSMEPEISDVDVIIVKEVDTQSLECGDIIAFYSRDPIIYGYINTHRIVEISQKGKHLVFVTKGDNNKGVDMVSAFDTDVIGRYKGKLPGGRLLNKAIEKLTNKYVYFAVMMVPLLICLCENIYTIVKIVTYAGEDSEESDEEPDDKSRDIEEKSDEES